jgi:hypothetical protein
VPQQDLQKKPSCYYCQSQEHLLDVCESFSSQTIEVKIEFLKYKGCCFGCLRRGHQKKDCRRKSNCSVCRKPHPTALHVDQQPEKPPEELGFSPNTVQSSFADVIGAGGSIGAGQECAMAIIPVKVKVNNGAKVVETYAFMDPGSSVTFCTETLIEQLGATGEKVKVTLNTMGSLHHMKSFVLSNLEVYGISNPESQVQLPKVYTKDWLPVSTAHVPTQKDIDVWPHLQNVKLKNISGKVELLIGNNVPDAYSPLEIKTGPSGSPHAVKSRLGWIVWNLMRPAKAVDGPLTVNHVDVLAVEKLEEIQKLAELYKQAVNRDFSENLSMEKKEHSQQDKLFLEKISSSTEMKNGHYQISLPLKHPSTKLPDNKGQALRRLKGIRMKMLRDVKYHEDYKKFVAVLLEKGYAEKVPEGEISRDDSRVWYIPHHAVYHPRKPGKIRVVQ